MCPDSPHLSAEHTVFANLDRSGDAHLGCHDGILADLHVVGDLHQIVQFHSLVDNGRIHYGPVDGRVGPYLHIVFQYDIPQLRDFLIVFSFGGKAESV